MKAVTQMTGVGQQSICTDVTAGDLMNGVLSVLDGLYSAHYVIPFQHRLFCVTKPAPVAGNG